MKITKCCYVCCQSVEHDPHKEEWEYGTDYNFWFKSKEYCMHKACMKKYHFQNPQQCVFCKQGFCPYDITNEAKINAYNERKKRKYELAKELGLVPFLKKTYAKKNRNDNSILAIGMRTRDEMQKTIFALPRKFK
eukprot:325285_1